MKNLLRAVAAGACLAVLSAAPAAASPFLIEAHLTGDPRSSNPDSLTVDVTITGDTTSAVTNWMVDLKMDIAHPDATLHEFAFNLVTSPPLPAFTVTNVAPNYSVEDKKLEGYGGGQAMFVVKLDKKGADASVTNSVPLTFTLTKTTGVFALSDFLNAACTEGGDNLGCNQMAAHLGSLSTNESSGIARGNYPEGSADPRLVPTPEPASIVLLGTGVAAAFARRRRRKTAA